MKKPNPKLSREEAVLQQSWAELEDRLRAAQWVAPQKGFAQRWQAAWRQEEARQQQLRSRWLLAANGLALLVLIAGPAIALWQIVRQPAAVFSAVVAFVVQAAGQLWLLLRVLASVLSLLPPPVWMAYLAASLGLLALWVLLYQQSPYKKELR